MDITCNPACASARAMLNAARSLVICVSGKYVHLSNGVVAISVTQRDIQWQRRGEVQCAPCADACARAVIASFSAPIVSHTAASWMVMALWNKDTVLVNAPRCNMHSTSAFLRAACSAEVIRQKPKTTWRRFFKLFRKEK